MDGWYSKRMEVRSRAFAATLLFGAPLLAGAVGALATTGAPDFYSALAKPSWAPPPQVFGPVWGVLYLLMGAAAFLVWKAHGWTESLLLFRAQLVFNALWSWLFFYFRLGTASLIDIVLLLLMILALAVWFFRLRPLAGVLLVPYAGWVGFATALNYAIVAANPTL